MFNERMSKQQPFNEATAIISEFLLFLFFYSFANTFTKIFHDKVLFAIICRKFIFFYVSRKMKMIRRMNTHKLKFFFRRTTFCATNIINFSSFARVREREDKLDEIVGELINICEKNNSKNFNSYKKNSS